MKQCEVENVKIGDQVIISQTGRDKGLKCKVIGIDGWDNYTRYPDKTKYRVPRLVLEPVDPDRIFYSGPQRFTRRMVTTNYGHLRLVREEL